MKDNTTQLEETKINISVRTGLMHNNKADEVQTQITFTGFYIQAMNYFVRLALEHQRDLEENSVTVRNDVKIRENLQFITQITEAFAEWLPDYGGDLYDVLTGKPETSQVLDLSAQSEDCQRLNKLAVHLSEVMKNPLTPEKIYNCLSEYLCEIPADTNSPEWVLGNLKIMSEVQK